MKQNNQGKLTDKLYDFYLEHGIIHINDEFNNKTSEKVIKELIFLDHNLPDNKKISILINSHGGSCYDGFSIIAIMDRIKENRKIECICLGSALSMGFLLLINASKGLRKAHYTSHIMAHLHSWSTGGGDSKYIESRAKGNIEYHNMMMQYCATKLDKTVKQIEQDFDRDKYFNATQALEYGIIDKIIGNK